MSIFSKRLSFLSSKSTRQNHVTGRRRKRSMLVEQLEGRRLLVIGAFAAAPATGRGAGFDGVVGLDLNNDSTTTSIDVECTGSLLESGFHVLTAAHCIDTGEGPGGDNGNGVPDSQNIRVVFDAADNAAGQFTIMTSTAVAMDAAYRSVGTGLDWAILTLPALAPFGADRYDLYRGNAEIGSMYTMAGYGSNGIEAAQTANGTTRQRGNNRWEQTVLGGTGLRSDFDDGTDANNLFGDTGVAGGDTFEGRGDSGGPGFLTVAGARQVAGIVSFGGTNFGSENVDTRVTSYLAAFDGVTDAASPLVIDFAFQPSLRNNGVTDNVLLRRNGGNIEVVVNSVVRQTRAAASVSSIRFVGSNDTDVLTIDESAGQVVPVGGVVFVGGEGTNDNDEFVYVGNNTQQVAYRPDANVNGNGVISIGGTRTITFSQLEPVTVSAVASLVITTPNSADVVTLDSPSANRNRISGSSGGVGFEEITFFSIPSVTVQLGTNDVAGSAADQFTMSAPGLVASGLNNFTINGGLGNDTFSVIGSPAATISVNGAAPVAGDSDVPPGDTLAVDATAFSNIVAPLNQPNGTVTATGMAPVNFTSIETLIASDEFENNDSIATSTILGSESEIILRDLSIHNATDQDFFRVTANETGKLFVRSMFTHAVGNLDLQIRGAAGELIQSANSVTNDETLVIPVVQGEDYFVRIFGAGGAIGNYALEIENFAVPVPTNIFLDPSSDSGMSASDAVTSDTTPRIFIESDLLNFVNTNGNAPQPAILTAAQAAAFNVPGFGVVLTFANVATGALITRQAEPLPSAAVANVFEVQIADLAPLPAGVYSVTAISLVVDGQTANQNGRSNLSEGFLITIDPAVPTTGPLDLIADSDSGTLDTDNVTSITTPTFTGTGEANSYVRLFANGSLVGTARVGSDGSDGVAGNGIGSFSVTSAALADGLNTMTYTLEDLAGNLSTPSPALQIEIDTTAPNTPYLDLLAADDSGRSNEDNVTNVNRFRLSATTHDAGPVPPHLLPNNLIYRIYARPEAGNEFLLFDSSTAIGGLTSLTQIFTTADLAAGATTLIALPDGAHNLKLEVEDRAGNISEDFLLPIVIDTAAPPVPTVAIDAGTSDTGVASIPETLVDRITSDTTSGFVGVAEANSIVRLFIDGRDISNGVVDASDVFQGLTTALPTDGNDAFPNGFWQITGQFDMNDPTHFDRDGVRQLAASAEDLAGNVSQPGFRSLYVDTMAPIVTRLNYENGDSVFAPKPNSGPTPRVDALQVTFSDQRESSNVFGGTLSGSQEVPMVISAATGQAELFFDPVTTTFDLTLTLSGLNITNPAASNYITNSHIHVGAAGANGLPIVNLGNAAAYTQVAPGVVRLTLDNVAFPAAQVASLEAGNTYINVHTVGNPAGEIRTQLNPLFNAPAVANALATDPSMYRVVGDHVGEILISEIVPTMDGGLVIGDTPDIVLILDVSGSTSDPFVGSAVGDLNGDGTADTILDAQIAAVRALMSDLRMRGLGDAADVSIIAFSSSGVALDLDPVTAGVQTFVTPNADADLNGVFDIDEIVGTLSGGGGTDFEDALTAGIDALTAQGTLPADGNVIFLSDGFPNNSNQHTDEAATIRGLANNVRAFGVGGGASLPQLQLIDPTAFIFTTTDELVAAFGGVGGGGMGGGAATPGDLRYTIRFAEPLPDDRFTLTIFDSLSDHPGNGLDGEVRANQPGLEAQILPSGNGLVGGDFQARFTVDSRPEIGVVSQAAVYVDINGNSVFDPEGQDNDETNRDFVYLYGLISDGHFAGNFSPVGEAASGYDKLGAYGFFAGSYSFIIDTNDDGVGDTAAVMPNDPLYRVNGIPVAGNFSDAKDGDEFGIFDGQAWIVDLNGNNAIEIGERIVANYNGLPLVGDFNGDGEDDFAVYNNATNSFIFDTNRDGLQDFVWDVRGDLNSFVGLSGFTDRPIAGDINLDGIDDIGLWVKGRDGVLPENSGEYFFWVSDRILPNPNVDTNPAGSFDEFSPDPLGNDLFAKFGNHLALPIFGNFDPPVAGSGGSDTRPSLTNSTNPNDVNNDGRVSPIDALMVVNSLNRGMEIPAGSSAARALAVTRGALMDTNADGRISPTDALRVINAINRGSGSQDSGGSQGEGESSVVSGYASAVDAALLGFLGDDEDDRLVMNSMEDEYFRVK